MKRINKFVELGFAPLMSLVFVFIDEYELAIWAMLAGILIFLIDWRIEAKP